MKVQLHLLTSAQGISAAEAQAIHNDTKDGFCDGVFVARIDFTDDRGTVVHFLSVDGRTEDQDPLGGPAVFYVWCRIAERLAKKHLPEPFRALCQDVWDRTESFVTAEISVPSHPDYHVRVNLSLAEEGSDDAVVLAMVDFKSLPFEISLTSLDGRTDEQVEPFVWWEVWAFLGQHIMEQYEAPPNIVALLRSVILRIKDLVLPK
jgi:hypothetical protein